VGFVINNIFAGNIFIKYESFHLFVTFQILISFLCSH